MQPDSGQHEDSENGSNYQAEGVKAHQIEAGLSEISPAARRAVLAALEEEGRCVFSCHPSVY